MAIFPPLTTNETAVLEILASDSAGDFTAEMIAESSGLEKAVVERALRSLESRTPPLAIAVSLAHLHWRSPLSAIAGGRPASRLLA